MPISSVWSPKQEMYMQIGTDVWILEVRHAYIQVMGPTLLEGKVITYRTLANQFVSQGLCTKKQSTLTKTHEELTRIS